MYIPSVGFIFVVVGGFFNCSREMYAVVFS